MNEGLVHGLTHLFKEILNEYEKHEKKKKAELQPIKPVKKEEEDFIWVSQNIRELNQKVVDLVEKGQPIPEFLFNRDPKRIFDLLKEWKRLDLIHPNLITREMKRKYPEFEILLDKDRQF